ncbi:hypothetical protein MBLNU230_g5543t1 [Neophaeotheca triangularis]
MSRLSSNPQANIQGFWHEPRMVRNLEHLALEYNHQDHLDSHGNMIPGDVAESRHGYVFLYNSAQERLRRYMAVPGEQRHLYRDEEEFGPMSPLLSPVPDERLGPVETARLIHNPNWSPTVSDDDSWSARQSNFSSDSMNSRGFEPLVHRGQAIYHDETGTIEQEVIVQDVFAFIENVELRQQQHSPGNLDGQYFDPPTGMGWEDDASPVDQGMPGPFGRHQPTQQTQAPRQTPPPHRIPRQRQRGEEEPPIRPLYPQTDMDVLYTLSAPVAACYNGLSQETSHLVLETLDARRKEQDDHMKEKMLHRDALISFRRKQQATRALGEFVKAISAWKRRTAPGSEDERVCEAFRNHLAFASCMTSSRVRLYDIWGWFSGPLPSEVRQTLERLIALGHFVNGDRYLLEETWGIISGVFPRNVDADDEWARVADLDQAKRVCYGDEPDHLQRGRGFGDCLDASKLDMKTHGNLMGWIDASARTRHQKFLQTEAKGDTKETYKVARRYLRFLRQARELVTLETWTSAGTPMPHVTVRDVETSQYIMRALDTWVAQMKTMSVKYFVFSKEGRAAGPLTYMEYHVFGEDAWGDEGEDKKMMGAYQDGPYEPHQGIHPLPRMIGGNDTSVATEQDEDEEMPARDWSSEEGSAEAGGDAEAEGDAVAEVEEDIIDEAF